MLKMTDGDSQSMPAYSPVTTDFGVDFTLPILRTGLRVDGRDYVGMVLHRQHLDVCFSDRVLLKQFPLSHGSVSIIARSQVALINCLFFLR